MDPDYLSSWLRQTRNAGPPQPPEDEERKEWSSSIPTSMEVDQPLDLSVKLSQPPHVKLSQPPSETSPLDLTVNKLPKVSQPGELRHSERQSSFSNRDSVNHGPAVQPLVHQPHTTRFPSNPHNFGPCSSNKKLHCSFCGYQCDLMFREHFNHHLAKHAALPHLYVCIHCQKSLPDQTALQEHLFVHGLLYQHVCALCSLAFNSQAGHWAHVNEMHKVSLPVRSPQGLRPDNGRGNTLLKVGPMRSRSASSAMSTDARSSPSSNDDSCASLQSPGMTARSSVSTPPQRSSMSLGQSIAKQIEAAISQKVAGGKNPSLSDLLFMKSEDDGESSTPSPLNLMSLLDKVVEESVKTAPGVPSQKPDLKFMVTFSDDEEEKPKECDSTVPNGTAQVSTSEVKHHVKETTEDDGEDAITSTERPVDGPASDQ